VYPRRWRPRATAYRFIVTRDIYGSSQPECRTCFRNCVFSTRRATPARRFVVHSGKKKQLYAYMGPERHRCGSGRDRMDAQWQEQCYDRSLSTTARLVCYRDSSTQFTLEQC
jgi:hypothetical protein